MQFEITQATGDALQAWIKRAGLKPEDFLFPSRLHESQHLGIRTRGGVLAPGHRELRTYEIEYRGTLVFTDAVPPSIALAEAHLSLLPRVWPLGAVRTKSGELSIATLRSQRVSSAALVLIDSTPPSAAASVM